MSDHNPTSHRTVGRITTVDFWGNEKFAIGKIMQGGMETVYQFVPIRADAHPVALKTLQGVMQISAFERECETWLSIAQHPNVARAIAYGEWEGNDRGMIIGRARQDFGQLSPTGKAIISYLASGIAKKRA
jgi:hypothetical protein